jgi:7,8-dihydroneopterin aldolase/epimerase/oxygenase
MTKFLPASRTERTEANRGITCQVMLNDIEVMADIGALAVELGVPQPLRIHVSLTVVPPSADDLTQTFDYSNIRVFAQELAAQRIVLIETFAQRLAQMCLADDVVLDAEVRIDKPKAVPGCLAGTRVKLGKG